MRAALTKRSPTCWACPVIAPVCDCGRHLTHPLHRLSVNMNLWIARSGDFSRARNEIRLSSADHRCTLTLVRDGPQQRLGSRTDARDKPRYGRQREYVDRFLSVLTYWIVCARVREWVAGGGPRLGKRPFAELPAHCRFSRKGSSWPPPSNLRPSRKPS